MDHIVNNYMENNIEYSKIRKLTLPEENEEGIISLYEIIVQDELKLLNDKNYNEILKTIKDTFDNAINRNGVAQDIIIVEDEKPEIKLKGIRSILEECNKWTIDTINYFLFNISKLSTESRNGKYLIGEEVLRREHGREERFIRHTKKPVDIRAGEQRGDREHFKRILDKKFFSELMKESEGSYDYSVSMGTNILRCHVYSVYGGGNTEKAALAIRIVPQKIPRIPDLNLPRKVEDIVYANRGLFLVSGRTGDGKSTTVASIVNKFNRDVDVRKVITIIEDPIEFNHKSSNARIIQRRLKDNVPSYKRAASDALRESTDIVVLGELRNKEEMIHALRLAEVGKLVIATIHANSVADTVERFVGELDKEKEHYRSRLLENLLGILHQNLVVYEGEQFPVSSMILIENDESRELLRKEGLTRESITKILNDDSLLWSVSRKKWFEDLKKEAEELNRRLVEGTLEEREKTEENLRKLVLLKGDAKKHLSIE